MVHHVDFIFKLQEMLDHLILLQVIELNEVTILGLHCRVYDDWVKISVQRGLVQIKLLLYHRQLI